MALRDTHPPPPPPPHGAREPNRRLSQEEAAVCVHFISKRGKEGDREFKDQLHGG